MLPLARFRRITLSTLAATVLLAACTGAPPAGLSTTVTTAATTVTTTSPAATTTTTLPPQTTTAQAGMLLTLRLVYNNTAADPRFTAAWGFSVLVEVPGGALLFDTGGDGALLLRNLTRFGIDPLTLHTVVLSHEHDDHTGGLPALLGAGTRPTVYLPASAPAGLHESISARADVVAVSGPTEILPGVFSTGEMGAHPVEQALVLQTPQGTVVLTGCAHPGIVDMVRRAREVLPGAIYLVVGGFHLGQASPDAVAGIIAAFREMGVQKVAPAHCTGDAAVAAFAAAYGDDFVAAGAGRVIEVG